MTEEINDDDPRIKALVEEIHQQNASTKYSFGNRAQATPRPSPGSPAKGPVSIFNRYMLQFKSKSLRGVAASFLPPLFLICTCIPVQLWLEKIEVERGIRGTWPIPKIDNLKEASGTLVRPYTIRLQRGIWSIGMLATDNGGFLQFSCLPGGDMLDCIYPGKYDDPTRSEQRISIKYFVMPKWLYPEYQIKFLGPNGASVVDFPRVPAAIVMEASVEKGGSTGEILNYEDSVTRLKRYMTSNSGIPFLPVNYGFLAMIAFFIPPALYRLITGRSDQTSELSRN